MNNIEIHRTDGKPECFGKQDVDTSRCGHCSVIKDCVSELCYTTDDARTEIVLHKVGVA